MLHRLITAIVSAVVVMPAAPALAIEMYATNHLGQYPDIGEDELIVFDSADPDGFQTVGPLGVPGIGFGGLDFDADGNLWAYASFYQATGGATGGLYRVDTSTGQATVQGTLSSQTLQDIAFNPVDGRMYGINTVQLAISTLYEIDLVTGAVSPVGQFSGLPEPHGLIGLAFDSAGNIYVHEQWSDAIYKGTAPDARNVSLLYQIQYNTLGSQGLTVDWSRDDTGYHGMVAQGQFPDYLSQVNTFATDGSSYVYGPNFGRNHPDGIPPVQAGDLAIRPDTSVAGDVDGDGDVDFDDLVALLADYGCVSDCVADLDGDGDVDFDDLVILLANYGTGG